MIVTSTHPNFKPHIHFSYITHITHTQNFSSHMYYQIKCYSFIHLSLRFFIKMVVFTGRGLEKVNFTTGRGSSGFHLVSPTGKTSKKGLTKIFSVYIHAARGSGWGPGGHFRRRPPRGVILQF